MRARDRIFALVLLALLAGFLACDEDPVAPPNGPTAAFVVTPESGWTDTSYRVDASSSDAGDGKSTLWVRWDWEDDGVWDTEWSEEKTAAHLYEAPGMRTIRLVVQDPWRRLAQSTRSVNVLRQATPETVVADLARAYSRRDFQLFKSLLVNDPDRDAEYLFLLAGPTDLGETQWGYAEELRIHQRMFEPENPPPGDPPVASELWLQGVSITLTKKESFRERPDLYTTNGGSLDPALWRAVDATYTTYVFFDLAGTDYKVEGEANFIVIDDLTKNAGDPGKHLLYIWEDIATSSPLLASARSTWGMVKGLYR